MWQKCPICNGTGVVPYSGLPSSSNTCSTCNGTKIISELTGLPPKREQNKTEHQKGNVSLDNPSSTDFRHDVNHDVNRETQQEYFNK